MDSRQLYKVAEHLRTTLNWEKNWIHLGTGNEVNYDFIGNLIKNFLKNERINFVHERTDSATIETIKILPIIKDLLGKSNFELWNGSMERAIQFNRIGVLLKGEKNALQQQLRKYGADSGIRMVRSSWLSLLQTEKYELRKPHIS